MIDWWLARCLIKWFWVDFGLVCGYCRGCWFLWLLRWRGRFPVVIDGDCLFVVVCIGYFVFGWQVCMLLLVFTLLACGL